MQRYYGFDIIYYRSWKGKEIALEDIHRSWEEAYRLLPSYMVQLARVDLGALICLVHEPDGSFLRFFWAFRPCIRSYKAHLMRVVRVDETHLMGSTSSLS